MSDTKQCNTCGRILPLSSFYLRGKGDRAAGTPRHQCKECRAKAASAYYQKHKEAHNKASNRYQRLKFAGFSEDHYNQKFQEQKGCCAICGKTVSEVKRKVLCADHNHATGNPRGLLCPICNSMLGYAYDDIAILEKAIQYLKKYEE